MSNLFSPSRRLPSAGARRASLAATVIIGAFLAGCAQAPIGAEARAEASQNNDPAEPTNRAIFRANQVVDHHVLQPVAQAYQDYVPGQVRHRLHDFVGNLEEPRTAVNDGLQENLRRAGETTLRFAVNSTVGVGGLFDVADGLGVAKHQADFGQTFGVWCAGPGPFVELPLFGPSNVRDSVGTALSFVANPFGSPFGGPAALADIGYAGTTIGVVDGRANLLGVTKDLEKNSLDYYATLRSVYAQRRAALIAEGKDPNLAKVGPDDFHPAPAIPAPVRPEPVSP